MDVEYLVSPLGMTVLRTHLVRAHSRLTVWVNQEGAELVDQGFGMVVRASRPVVAERATYIASSAGQFEAGETSVGVPTTAQDWYFAEGVSGPAFDTYLLLANPSESAAEVIPVNAEYDWAPQTGFGMHLHVTNGVEVRVTLGFEDGGTPISADVTVAAGRRVTVDVGTLFPTAMNRRFSARVESLNAAPILVEQSMYWSHGTGVWKTGVSLPATPLQP